MTRMPIVAGRFYPDSPAQCRKEAEGLLKNAQLPVETPKGCIGALAPHAGWICSGKLAAITIKALCRHSEGETAPRTYIIFGAAHRPVRHAAAVSNIQAWSTPLGDIEVDTELAAAIINGCEGAAPAPDAHLQEHSIEVLLPILQVADPGCRIVPIMVPPSKFAVEVGQKIAAIAASTQNAVSISYLGSTDLTHYGTNYGITPAGTGDAGLKWATDNDSRLLDIISRMDADSVVAEASSRHNACGGGAIAACMAACSSAGAGQCTILAHTNSYEALRQYYPNDKSNAVGYCSVVFS